MERTRISFDEPLPPVQRHSAGARARLGRRRCSLRGTHSTTDYRCPYGRACWVATQQAVVPGRVRTPTRVRAVPGENLPGWPVSVIAVNE